jgi:ankyrin repeat protein
MLILLKTNNSGIVSQVIFYSMIENKNFKINKSNNYFKSLIYNDFLFQLSNHIDYFLKLHGQRIYELNKDDWWVMFSWMLSKFIENIYEISNELISGSRNYRKVLDVFEYFLRKEDENLNFSLFGESDFNDEKKLSKFEDIITRYGGVKMVEFTEKLLVIFENNNDDKHEVSNIETILSNIDKVKLEINDKNVNDIYKIGSQKQPLLHILITSKKINSKNKPEILKYLLSIKGIQMNSRDRRGETPLHRAFKSGSIDIINILLNTNGVDVNVQDNKGKAVLHISRVKFLPILLKLEDIDVNIKDIDGNTPLHLAINKGSQPIIKILMDKSLKGNDININEENNEGMTPLHLSVIKGNANIIRLLLNDENIDINVQDTVLNTPLYYIFVNDTPNPNKIRIFNMFLKSQKLEIELENNSGYDIFEFLIFNLKGIKIPIIIIQSILEEYGNDIYKKHKLNWWHLFFSLIRNVGMEFDELSEEDRIILFAIILFFIELFAEKYKEDSREIDIVKYSEDLTEIDYNNIRIFSNIANFYGDEIILQVNRDIKYNYKSQLQRQITSEEEIKEFISIKKRIKKKISKKRSALKKTGKNVSNINCEVCEEEANYKTLINDKIYDVCSQKCSDQLFNKLKKIN